MHPSLQYGRYHLLLPWSVRPVFQVPERFLSLQQSSPPSDHLHLQRFLHGISFCLRAIPPYHKRNAQGSYPTQILTYQAKQKAPGSDNSVRYLPHKSSYQQDNRQNAIWLYQYPGSYKQRYHPHEARVYGQVLPPSGQPTPNHLPSCRKSLSPVLP